MNEKRLATWIAPALLFAAMAATVVIYWIGLQGPFLLDDFINLNPIDEWLRGQLGIRTLIFERGAGTFGRPLSMASLALNAWLGGYTPFSLKFGNLLVHLICGGVIYVLLRQLLQRDRTLNKNASVYAAIVATLWLLHPLHASTVLYAVQRMAQMSTLFVLLGLWIYVSARFRLLRGPSPFAAAGLLIGIPVMTALAFLSKENGILLPLLCAVIELAYFRDANRQLPVRAFHICFVIFPIAVGMSGLALNPKYILDGYLGRDFTLTERLLSQGRVLCEYLWNLIAPNPPRMGLYTDDFSISTGFLSPPSTLLALILLAGISAGAWASRKRFPAVFFGWFFFLVAHSLEAGIIPLELYFEHRNYLPSLGIFLAMVALFVWFGEKLKGAGLRPRRIGVVLLTAFVAVLVVGTHGRARVWRDPLLIAESSLQSHPESLRANAYLLSKAIEYDDLDRMDSILDTLLNAEAPRSRSMGHAYRVYVDCLFKQTADPADLEAFVTQTPLPITLAESQPFRTIYEFTGKRDCGPITDHMMGTALARLADREKPGLQNNMFRLRYQSANFLARAQDWNGALIQGRKAWQHNAEPPISVPLILAQLHLGDIDGATQTLAEVEARADASNAQDRIAIDWLREQIEAASKAIATREKMPAG